MSQSSEFEDKAKNAIAVVESLGHSGNSYVFFFFDDNSVTAAKRVKAISQHVSAQLNFNIKVKEALDDCGVSDFDGTTYQKGRELLRRWGIK
jgi:hypothetical protein